MTDETGWRPIETAPRDGTAVLVNSHMHSNDVHGYVPWKDIGVLIAWWDGSGWEGCFMEDGTADTEGYSSQFFQTVRPTHWMPLPPPPPKEP